MCEDEENNHGMQVTCRIINLGGHKQHILILRAILLVGIKYLFVVLFFFVLFFEETKMKISSSVFYEPSGVRVTGLCTEHATQRMEMKVKCTWKHGKFPLDFMKRPKLCFSIKVHIT